MKPEEFKTSVKGYVWDATRIRARNSIGHNVDHLVFNLVRDKTLSEIWGSIWGILVNAGAALPRNPLHNWHMPIDLGTV